MDFSQTAAVTVPLVGAVSAAVFASGIVEYKRDRAEGGMSRRQAFRSFWRYWMPAAVVIVMLSMAVGGWMAREDPGPETNNPQAGPSTPGDPTRSPSESPSSTPTLASPDNGDGNKPPEPTLRIEPDTAFPGQTITVKGSGFDPGERVRLYWEGEHVLEELLRDTVADDRGAISTQVVVIEHPYHEPRSRHTDWVTAEGLSSDVSVDSLVVVTT